MSNKLKKICITKHLWEGEFVCAQNKKKNWSFKPQGPVDNFFPKPGALKSCTDTKYRGSLGQDCPEIKNLPKFLDNSSLNYRTVASLNATPSQILKCMWLVTTPIQFLYILIVQFISWLPVAFHSYYKFYSIVIVITLSYKIIKWFLVSILKFIILTNVNWNLNLIFAFHSSGKPFNWESQVIPLDNNQPYECSLTF